MFRPMTHATTFHWLGNLPCLDFVNTEAMADGERVDLLVGFGGLVGWLTEAGFLTDAGAKAALERGEGKTEGASALRQAVAFRQGLRRMVERLSEGKSPPADEVELINRILAERTTHAR